MLRGWIFFRKKIADRGEKRWGLRVEVGLESYFIKID